VASDTQIDKLAQLRALRGGPRDGALLRVSLANVLLDLAHLDEATAELRAALGFDPDYSAAWKLLGATLAENGDIEAARVAYRSGIAAADKRGDKQAGKEMQVFLRRLEK
jgi:Flp pilus assembly protein TadD